MSLDVYLTGPEETYECPECHGTGKRTERPELYGSNITHNLGRMASAAGIYQELWRPDENGITKARELIEPLSRGLALLKADPKRFKKLDAKNGSGTYEHFVPWVEKYLAACRENPEADVNVCR